MPRDDKEIAFKVDVLPFSKAKLTGTGKDVGQNFHEVDDGGIALVVVNCAEQSAYFFGVGHGGVVGHPDGLERPCDARCHVDVQQAFNHGTLQHLPSKLHKAVRRLDAAFLLSGPRCFQNVGGYYVRDDLVAEYVKQGVLQIPSQLERVLFGEVRRVGVEPFKGDKPERVLVAPFFLDNDALVDLFLLGGVNAVTRVPWPCPDACGRLSGRQQGTCRNLASSVSRRSGSPYARVCRQ